MVLKDIYFKPVGLFFVGCFFEEGWGGGEEKFAIISFPQLLHEKRETQDEINGKQRVDNIFHRIYYGWLNAIKKKKSAFDGIWK